MKIIHVHLTGKRKDYYFSTILGVWRSSASMGGVDAMGLIGLIKCWTVLAIFVGESMMNRYEDYTRAFDG